VERRSGGPVGVVPLEGFEPPTPSLRSAESSSSRGTRLFAAVRGNALSYTDGRAFRPLRLMYSAGHA
jgi:hypothetical protein